MQLKYTVIRKHNRAYPTKIVKLENLTFYGFSVGYNQIIIVLIMNNFEIL
jgi:hypothetical protein